MSLNVLTRACKLVNDTVKTCLPIQIGLLELMLFELECIYDGNKKQQPFLEMMYKAIFSLAYYGLMRIGELTSGAHPILAKDLHIGQNKDKILILLYSSKTHGKESRPQEIKITAVRTGSKTRGGKTRHFCPFKLLRQYIAMRGSYNNDNEPLFVFADGSPVEPKHVRKVMKQCIKQLGLDSNLYNCSSWRSGRASDLQFFGYSVPFIMRAGRWKSPAIFRYLRGVTG